MANNDDIIRAILNRDPLASLDTPIDVGDEPVEEPKPPVKPKTGQTLEEFQPLAEPPPQPSLPRQLVQGVASIPHAAGGMVAGAFAPDIYSRQLEERASALGPTEGAPLGPLEALRNAPGAGNVLAEAIFGPEEPEGLGKFAAKTAVELAGNFLPYLLTPGPGKFAAKAVPALGIRAIGATGKSAVAAKLAGRGVLGATGAVVGYGPEMVESIWNGAQEAGQAWNAGDYNQFGKAVIGTGLEAALVGLGGVGVAHENPELIKGLRSLVHKGKVGFGKAQATVAAKAPIPTVPAGPQLSFPFEGEGLKQGPAPDLANAQMSIDFEPKPPPPAGPTPPPPGPPPPEPPPTEPSGQMLLPMDRFEQPPPAVDPRQYRNAAGQFRGARAPQPVPEWQAPQEQLELFSPPRFEGAGPIPPPGMGNVPRAHQQAANYVEVIRQQLERPDLEPEVREALQAALARLEGGYTQPPQPLVAGRTEPPGATPLQGRFGAPGELPSAVPWNVEDPAASAMTWINSDPVGREALRRVREVIPDLNFGYLGRGGYSVVYRILDGDGNPTGYVMKVTPLSGELSAGTKGVKGVNQPIWQTEFGNSWVGISPEKPLLEGTLTAADKERFSNQIREQGVGIFDLKRENLSRDASGELILIDENAVRPVELRPRRDISQRQGEFELDVPGFGDEGLLVERAIAERARREQSARIMEEARLRQQAGEWQGPVRGGEQLPLDFGEPPPTGGAGPATKISPEQGGVGKAEQPPAAPPPEKGSLAQVAGDFFRGLEPQLTTRLDKAGKEKAGLQLPNGRPFSVSEVVRLAKKDPAFAVLGKGRGLEARLSEFFNPLVRARQTSAGVSHSVYADIQAAKARDAAAAKAAAAAEAPPPAQPAPPAAEPVLPPAKPAPPEAPRGTGIQQQLDAEANALLDDIYKDASSGPRGYILPIPDARWAVYVAKKFLARGVGFVEGMGQFAEDIARQAAAKGRDATDDLAKIKLHAGSIWKHARNYAQESGLLSQGRDVGGRASEGTLGVLDGLEYYYDDTTGSVYRAPVGSVVDPKRRMRLANRELVNEGGSGAAATIQTAIRAELDKRWLAEERARVRQPVGERLPGEPELGESAGLPEQYGIDAAQLPRPREIPRTEGVPEFGPEERAQLDVLGAAAKQHADRVQSAISELDRRGAVAEAPDSYMDIFQQPDVAKVDTTNPVAMARAWLEANPDIGATPGGREVGKAYFERASGGKLKRLLGAGRWTEAYDTALRQLDEEGKLSDVWLLDEAGKLSRRKLSREAREFLNPVASYLGSRGEAALLGVRAFISGLDPTLPEAELARKLRTATPDVEKLKATTRESAAVRSAVESAVVYLRAAHAPKGEVLRMLTDLGLQPESAQKLWDNALPAASGMRAKLQAIASKGKQEVGKQDPFAREVAGARTRVAALKKLLDNWDEEKSKLHPLVRSLLRPADLAELGVAFEQNPAVLTGEQALRGKASRYTAQKELEDLGTLVAGEGGKRTAGTIVKADLEGKEGEGGIISGAEARLKQLEDDLGGTGREAASAETEALEIIRNLIIDLRRAATAPGSPVTALLARQPRMVELLAQLIEDHQGFIKAGKKLDDVSYLGVAGEAPELAADVVDFLRSDKSNVLLANLVRTGTPTPRVTPTVVSKGTPARVTLPGEAGEGGFGGPQPGMGVKQRGTVVDTQRGSLAAEARGRLNAALGLLREAGDDPSLHPALRNDVVEELVNSARIAHRLILPARWAKVVEAGIPESSPIQFTREELREIWNQGATRARELPEALARHRQARKAGATMMGFADPFTAAAVGVGRLVKEIFGSSIARPGSPVARAVRQVFSGNTRIQQAAAERLAHPTAVPGAPAQPVPGLSSMPWYEERPVKGTKLAKAIRDSFEKHGAKVPDIDLSKVGPQEDIDSFYRASKHVGMDEDDQKMLAVMTVALNKQLDRATRQTIQQTKLDALDLLASKTDEQLMHGGKTEVSAALNYALRMLHGQRAEEMFDAKHKLLGLKIRGVTSGPAWDEAEKGVINTSNKWYLVATQLGNKGTNLGRALRMYRELYEAADPRLGLKAKMFSELAKRLSPEDVAAMRKLYDAGEFLEFTKLLPEAYNPTKMDYIAKMWKSGLVTSFKSLIANDTGNELMRHIKRLMNTTIAPAVEDLLRGSGVKGIADAPKQRYYGAWTARRFGEAYGSYGEYGAGTELIRGIYGARYFQKWFEDLKRAVKGGRVEGFAQGYLEDVRRDVKLPKIGPVDTDKLLGWGMRMLELRDNFSKQRAAGAELSERLYNRFRQGGANHTDAYSRMQEELPKYLDAYREFLSTGIETPAWKSSRQLFEDVTAAVKNIVFQEDIKRDANLFERIAFDLKQAKIKHPSLDFAVPFVNAPFNIARETLRMTPFGFYSAIKRYKEGKIDAYKLHEELAKPIFGSILATAIYPLVMDGTITGGGHPDPNVEAEMRQAGWLPYSIKLGDTYISYQRMEPLAGVLGTMADLYEGIKAGEVENSNELTLRLVGAIQENLTNKTFMSGLEGLFTAWSDPLRYSGRLARQFQGSFVPAFVGAAAQAVDPVYRETKSSWLGPTVARLPYLSRFLEAQSAPGGEERTRPGTAIERFVSPFSRSTLRKDPQATALMELARLGYAPKLTERALKVKGLGKVKLSEDEYQSLQVSRQRALREIASLVGNPAYDNLPDDDDAAAVMGWTGKTKRDVLRRMLERYTEPAARRAKMRAAMRARMERAGAPIA